VEITEVRIKLMEDGDDRLQGFCSITFDDCFVVRDLKIIEGANGPFVAMPSRKLTSHCPRCTCKNHLRASYCNHCGSQLRDDLAIKDADGRAKLYADIAHPINSACRELIQERVITEYRAEQIRAQQPGYVSRYDDYYEFDADTRPTPERTHHRAESEPRAPHKTPAQKSPDQGATKGQTGGFGAGIFSDR
jgi:stage V sporulation protein G